MLQVLVSMTKEEFLTFSNDTLYHTLSISENSGKINYFLEIS